MREVVTATGDLGVHPPVAWYRQVKSGKEQLQDTAQVVSRCPAPMRGMPPPPLRKMEPAGLLRICRVLQPGRTQTRHPTRSKEIIYHRRGNATAKNPKTNANVSPTPLDGDALSLEPGQDPRIALADWMTQPDNPFFAKMLVNRYWKHFFGRGLVEPGG